MEININHAVVREKSPSESSQVQYSRLSFYELLEAVLRQIDFGAFGRGDQKQVREIAMIIAEVFRLPDSAKVRIDKNDLPVMMIAEIYGSLEHEHIEHVLDNYKKVAYEIKHPKTYLRTALYNSVFELESKIDNTLRAVGAID